MIINALIPARLGSQRLKFKNLALINNKPLIEYAINNAKRVRIFDDIFVNSEHVIFQKIAKRNNVSFYLRPSELGSSSTKIDDVIYDFMINNSADITVLVNTPSPLIKSQQLKASLDHFIKNNFDTLITTTPIKRHSIIGNTPINYSEQESLKRTQDLTTLRIFNYSVMIWKNDLFTKNYNEKGYAFFSGKVGYYDLDKYSDLIVKNEDDLFIVDSILRNNTFHLEFDSLVEDLFKV